MALSYLRRLAVALFCAICCASVSSASTFTVTNVNDLGSGSLRAAILNANANAGPDVVEFNIAGAGPFLIVATTAMTVNEQVTIDGTSQPGFAGSPRIGIRGGTSVDCLTLTVPDCVVKGLAFKGNRTSIRSLSNCVVDGCWFGITPDNTTQSVLTGLSIEGGMSSSVSNCVVASAGVGIGITNSSFNTIKNCRIGTDPTGTVVTNTVTTGVQVTGGSNNVIGGTAIGEGNLISGNFSNSGVLVTSSPSFGFYGNTCGTNSAGTAALGSTTGQFATMLKIVSSPDCNVGMPGTRDGSNLFAGRITAAIHLEDSDNAKVVSNTVGLNRAGTGFVTNNSVFVCSRFLSCDNVQIGDGGPIGRNVLAGGFQEVVLNTCTNCVVDGNYLNTDATGTVFLQGMGTSDAACILVQGGTGNRIGREIGGTTEANVFCNRTNLPGVLFTGSSSGPGGPCQVIGNAFGFAADFVTPLGDMMKGISASSFGAPAGQLFEENVFGHVTGGIDLGGGSTVPGFSYLTANDNGDVDSGPNGLLNYPVLTYAVTEGGVTRIRGRKDATVTNYVRLSFFSSPTVANWTGAPAGAHYLGSYEYPAGNNLGVVPFDLTFAESVPVGHAITVTATDSTNSTSEFSRWVFVETNSGPVANAGVDKSFTIPHDKNPNTNTQAFTLTGSATDPTTGDVLTYEWRDEADNVVGTSATLSTSRQAGTYTFTLTVTDLAGLSSSDTATVTIAPEPNQIPTGSVPADRTVVPNHVTNEVTETLTGSANDADADPLTYKWELEGGGVVGTTQTVSVTLTPGDHTFVFTARDPYGAEFSGSTTIHVDHPPVANAGPDITVRVPHDGVAGTETASFTLDATGSHDPDSGDTLSYQWIHFSGGSSDAQPTFHLPPGSYTYTLIVRDQHNAYSEDTVVVEVLPELNPPPVADAGPDQNLLLPNGETTMLVTVPGGGSDPDGDTLSYQWFNQSGSFLSSDQVLLANLGTGSHTFTLVVTDTYGATSSDTVTIHIEASNRPPTVEAGPNRSATAAANGMGTLTLEATYSDPDGDAVTLQWFGPGGSLGVGTPVTVSLPAGINTVTVTATDSNGATATDSLLVSVFYSWSGFLQPINMDNSSIFKLGSTVPVKFRLTGISDGAAITARIYIAKVSNGIIGSEFEPETNVQADAGNVFRNSGGQYIYNWSTKGLSVGTYQIRADLGDGNPNRVVLVSLK